MKTGYTICNLFIAITLLVLTGCTKNITKYNADSEDPGLAIFSNKGNNLMTCYVNGKPWKTTDKKTTSTGPGLIPEVVIRRMMTNSTQDTLIFSWLGDYQVNGPQAIAQLNLLLPIPKTFTIKDIAALQGQRLSIDTLSNNGAFAISSTVSGNGNIFFETVKIDSISPGNYFGQLSGLLDANLPGYAITRGRFDHSLSLGQFYNF
ncbi:hypothetical protein BH11BAC3_BH11BAC3_38820 [soil metagenome]